jgi:hypothetical protein
MAEPTKADLEAKLAERDAEIDDLKAQLSQQAGKALPAVSHPDPEGGPITSDLPASRTPVGADPYNPAKPEVGQYVGHGATSIASSYGTFTVDPATGLVDGQVGANG